jgi:phosphatidylserine/phosphatidylglycerophosphate/cardiolipin synthase-like enzyme
VPDATGVVCRATFSPGGGCIPLILAELNQATSRVDVAMFYFSSDALVDMLCRLSAERGIRVRVLVESEMDKPATRLVLEKLRDHGVEVFVVEPGSAGKLHHKCAVVDENVVLTGAANWSEAAEQSNHEDVLALYTPALAAQYLAHFDELQAKGIPLAGPPPSKIARRVDRRPPPPRRNLPGTEGIAKSVRVYYTPAREAILADLIPQLRSAKTVDVGMFLLSDKELLAALAEIAPRATVRVVVDAGAVAGRGIGNLQVLWNAGVKIAVFHGERASMHLKSVVIDDRYVWTGSANWTQGAIDSNYEDMLCLDSPDLAGLYARKLRDIYAASRSFQEQALNLSVPESGSGENVFSLDLPLTGPRTDFTDFARTPFEGFEATGKVRYVADEEYQPLLRKLIQGARQSIFIGMYVFSEQKSEAPFAEQVIADLKAAARRGVYVYLLLYTAPSTLDRLAEHHSNRAEHLRQAGIDVRLALPNNILHLKAVVVDLSMVLVGSHNWSEGALSGKRDYEASALIVLDAQEPKLADFLLSRKTISDMRSRELWEQEITTLRHLNQASGKERDDLLAELEGRE